MNFNEGDRVVVTADQTEPMLFGERRATTNNVLIPAGSTGTVVRVARQWVSIDLDEDPFQYDVAVSIQYVQKENADG